MQVVILEQQDLAFELRHARDTVQLADDILPGYVCRVRLAREDEQDGSRFITENRAQPVEILEQQRGALVSREAARETHGQYVRIDRIGVAQQAVEMRFRTVVAEMLACHAMAHQMQHLRFQRLPNAPEQMIRHGFQAFLESMPGGVVGPVEAEILVEGVDPFRREESRYVHAVRYIGQRILPRLEFWPQRCPDTRGHAPWYACPTILKARPASGQCGQVESH